MNKPTPDRRVREEAADWFARLNARTVSVADLEAFRDWRRLPAHREAYESIEETWRGAGDLRQDPEIQAALAQAVVRPRRRPRAAPAWLAAAAVASVLIAIGGVWLTQRPEVFVTGVGERRVVRLSDGSEIHLDTASRVTARLEGNRRAIRLEQGQALFEVASDRTRPFTVTAGAVQVIATGTRFDVRRDRERVRVTLVEGGVVVRDGAEDREWRLAPSEQITAGAAGTNVAAPIRVDARSATAWTVGRLEFDAVPLSIALAEINRYETRPLILGVGVDPTLPISGAFDAGHGPAFAEATARIHGLEVRPAAGGLRLERRPQENSSRPSG